MVFIDCQYNKCNYNEWNMKNTYTFMNNFGFSVPNLFVPRLLLPTNVVCEGYVFTGVCLSTWGEYLTRYTPGQTPPRQTPPGRHPLGQTPPRQTPPWADTPPAVTKYTPWLRLSTPPWLGLSTPPWLGLSTPPADLGVRYGQRAGGTHPTGMHSCLLYNHYSKTWARSLIGPLDTVAVFAHGPRIW